MKAWLSPFPDGFRPPSRLFTSHSYAVHRAFKGPWYTRIRRRRLTARPLADLGHEFGVKAMNNYDLSKIGVLVVEKQAPMRNLLRQVLREFGVVKVDDAMTPEDGFERFNETTPDLVLVDWAPDFDGLKLVQRIRTDEESVFPQVPVIMVTAFNETNHIFEALDAGMTEYMTKPISAKLLYLRIVSVIENKRSFIRAGEFIGPDRRRRISAFGGPDRRDETAGNTGTETMSPDENNRQITAA